MCPIIIDEQSFRYYYDLYYYDLCKSLNYYTTNVEVIEDAVQDVFVSLWENKATVDISYIKTYLFVSVRNKMLNVLRNDKRFEIPLEDCQSHAFALEPEDEKSSFNEALYQTTQEAINALPSKCKDLFVLSKMQNLTYKQIAEDKQISVKTVENQIGIALKKIRRYVEQKAAFSVLLALFFSIP